MRTWNSHKGVIIENKYKYDLIDCKICGFKHIVPIPKKEELGEYYSKTYYSDRKPDYCRQQFESKEWWDLVYSERFERFEKYLKKNNSSKRILDIGSGPGFFLKYGLDRGWDVLGIEPSKHASEFSKSMGVNVINEGIEDVIYNEIGKFDIIHMQGVIEHLRSPVETLKLCQELLNENGLICFTVANEFNTFQKILVENYMYDKWWFVPPEHINYFDIPSLENLISNSGFEVISVLSSFPMEMFLLFGENYTLDNQLGSICQQKRLNFEKALNKNKAFKEEFYKALASIGIGRTVEIIAYKKNNYKVLEYEKSFNSRS